MAKELDENPCLLGVREVARLLGCPTNTGRVRKMLKDKVLRGVKIGRETRVLTSSWKEFIQQNTI